MERKLNAVADGWELNQLLHPAQAFGLPLEVVNDPDLSLKENVPFWRRGRPMHVRWKPRGSCTFSATWLRRALR